MYFNVDFKTITEEPTVISQTFFENGKKYYATVIVEAVEENSKEIHDNSDSELENDRPLKRAREEEIFPQQMDIEENLYWYGEELDEEEYEEEYDEEFKEENVEEEARENGEKQEGNDEYVDVNTVPVISYKKRFKKVENNDYVNIAGYLYAWVRGHYRERIHKGKKYNYPVIRSRDRFTFVGKWVIHHRTKKTMNWIRSHYRRM
jgi:hypothetical protein